MAQTLPYDQHLLLLHRYGTPSTHSALDLNLFHFLHDPSSFLVQGFPAGVSPACLTFPTLPAPGYPDLSHLSITPLYGIYVLQKASPHPC